MKDVWASKLLIPKIDASLPALDKCRKELVISARSTADVQMRDEVFLEALSVGPIWNVSTDECCTYAGWSMRTPQGFMGPPAALVVPPQWALQDMSSASVRPPRTSSVVDPAACPGTCPMGPVLSPYNADAGLQ